jgi:hypothetical protein
MLAQRVLWGSGTITSAVMAYLAFAQVQNQLARWSFGIIFGLLFIVSMVRFPWGQNDDGSPRSLLSLAVSGQNNATVATGGDSSPVTGNVLATGGSTVHQHGLTVDQIDRLQQHVDGQVAGEVERFVSRQLESIRADFVRFTGDANAQAMATAHQLLTTFVEQLAARAPENIDSIRTPSMQQAILNATTSAAVADDEQLTETLVGILVDKSGEGPRSFKGVVLTEALEVAGKLTSDQVNLLTALVMLTRTLSHGLDTVDQVLAELDLRCQPLYGKLPTSNNALQYAVYTGVGNEGIAPQAMANHIVKTYDAVFTQGFTVEQLPEGLKPVSANLPHVDARIRVDNGDQPRLRFPTASSQSLDRLKDMNELNEPYLTHIAAMKDLIDGNPLPPEKFTSLAETEKPGLARFLADLDQIGAANFRLTSVGVGIGQANWRRLDPTAAPDVDIYFT